VFLDKIVPIQYNRTIVWTPTFLYVFLQLLSLLMICVP
jgi:hypothetical protein